MVVAHYIPVKYKSFVGMYGNRECLKSVQTISARCQHAPFLNISSRLNNVHKEYYLSNSTFPFFQFYKYVDMLFDFNHYVHSVLIPKTMIRALFWMLRPIIRPGIMQTSFLSVYLFFLHALLVSYVNAVAVKKQKK